VKLPDRLLLADKSAWERAAEPDVQGEWVDALTSGRIVTCMPVRYELLYPTRDAHSFAALDRRLAALRDVPITASIQRAAMTALADLAAVGPLHHRVPLADLLIAAAAQAHGVVVLHEDRHFELLQRVMSFEAQRLLG
jgi:predicted nucleic acid-binding protein